MGSGRGRRSRITVPLCQKLLLGGFFPYISRHIYPCGLRGKTEARGLEQRVWQSPNSLNAALVYKVSSLFPSRWTHEDQLEAVADTTENCVWVEKEARQLGRVDFEAPEGPGNPFGCS